MPDTSKPVVTATMDSADEVLASSAAYAMKRVLEMEPGDTLTITRGEEGPEMFRFSSGRVGEPDREGLRVARRSAGWYLGDPSWADKLVGAYLQPKETDAFLAREMGDDDA